jgi:hypothetical protein
MNRAHRTLKFLVAAAALASACASHATVLNFDTYNAATYGDRVTVFGTGYGAAGGATPNVVLDFVPLSGSDFFVYGSGYATLTNALGHSGFDQPGYIQFTPDAGFDVVLSAFDLAGWSGASYPNSQVRIVDSSGTVYLDTGLFTYQPNTVRQWAGLEIRSSLPLRLLINDFGDLGVDNIGFGQVASVPEASSLAMLLAGLGAIATLTRRRLRQA